MAYRYFRRDGGTGTILNLYRIPAELYDGVLDFKHFRVMEVLLPSGKWVSGNCNRLEADWMHGWFNKNDEITEEEAQNVILKWKDEGLID
jgi:hypothetical protein